MDEQKRIARATKTYCDAFDAYIDLVSGVERCPCGDGRCMTCDDTGRRPLAAPVTEREFDRAHARMARARARLLALVGAA